MGVTKKIDVLKHKIHIPERANAPETKLYIKKISKTKEMGDRPVIFVLPGGPGMDHRVYQKYECLIDVADLIFHDPRGCGQSDKGDPLTYSMENYIEDVDVLRKSLSLDKIIVLGKSYGSVCAMGYALRYQNVIEKLVLSAGAPSYRCIDTAKKNLARLGTPEQIQLCEKLWNGEFKSNYELAEFFIATAPLYSNHLTTRLESYVLAYYAMDFSFEATNLGFSDFLRRFDFEPDLHLIDCNTLILAGKNDWVNDVSHAKIMAEKIPNNIFKIFEDSGHAMESDAHDIYFETIRQFILSSTD